MAPVSIEAGGATATKKLVLFDASKAEQFSLNNGFRNLHRKLKNAWRVESNTEEIHASVLQDCRVYVIAGPRAKFTQAEFEELRGFVAAGGSVLVLLGEGGESQVDTNINFLLEEYGIVVNSDCVVRTVFYKYFHPKEALVSNGVLNRAVAVAAGKPPTSALDDDENNAQALTYVYAYGATLSVNRLSVPVLSTGSVCYPLNRPVCAFHTATTNGGKLAVLGSVHMFSDKFIDKEENMKILDVVLRFLTEELKLNSLDAEDPDIADYHPIPDHLYLADQLKVCLQEGETDMPTRDLTRLFDGSLYAMDLALMPKCVRAYEELQVKHEALSLIAPQFELPMPPLQAAIYPPNFRELPPPHLELFDLDDVFSSEGIRLAQTTNKCGEADLDYFIQEAGDILGVTGRLDAARKGAAFIVEFIFNQVAEFKKLNQEPDADFADDEQQFSDLEDDYDF